MCLSLGNGKYLPKFENRPPNTSTPYLVTQSSKTQDIDGNTLPEVTAAWTCLGMLVAVTHKGSVEKDALHELVPMARRPNHAIGRLRQSDELYSDPLRRKLVQGGAHSRLYGDISQGRRRSDRSTTHHGVVLLCHKSNATVQCDQQVSAYGSVGLFHSFNTGDYALLDSRSPLYFCNDIGSVDSLLLGASQQSIIISQLHLQR